MIRTGRVMLYLAMGTLTLAQGQSRTCQPAAGKRPGWATGTPEGTEAVDPISLERSEWNDGAAKYRFPAGWHLLLARGFEIAPSLPDDRALVYHDNCCIMVLDGGARRPRKVHYTWFRDYVGCGHAWSADGQRYYDFFDCKPQLVSIDVATGAMRSLSNYTVGRNYKGHAHIEPMIKSPLVYDDKKKRLLYIEQDYERPHDAQLVSVSLANGRRVPVSRRLKLSGFVYHWDVALDEERFYTLTYSHSTGERKLEMWNLEGERLESSDSHLPECPGRFDLSPDKRLMVVDTGDQGCVYDLDGKGVVQQLPEGCWYRWSPDGDTIAFLRPAEEVWLLEVEAGEARRLGKIEPLETAPAWSRDRHYEAPFWSRDSRMLSVGLSTYEGPGGFIRSITLLFDLETKQVVVLPYRGYRPAWSPVPKPFPNGLSEARNSGTAG